MTLFECLLVGHLVGDYLLQNGWMAEGKTTRWVPLLVHTTFTPWRWPTARIAGIPV